MKLIEMTYWTMTCHGDDCDHELITRYYKTMEEAADAAKWLGQYPENKDFKFREVIK